MIEGVKTAQTIRNLPVSLGMLIQGGSGFVCFNKHHNFIETLELPMKYESACFFNDNIVIHDTAGNAFSFGWDQWYDYKKIPVLLAWLKLQDLHNPFERA